MLWNVLWNVSVGARRENGRERNNLDQDEVHSVKIVFQIEIFCHLRTLLGSCQQVPPSYALQVAAGDQRTSVVHGARPWSIETGEVGYETHFFC